MKATRIYTLNKQAIKDGHTVIANQGGSRSGKTYNIVLLLINIAIKNPNVQITVVSQSLPHLKRGALKDFEVIMHKTELMNLNNYNRTDRKYNFSNGSYIEFFGVDSWGKVIGSNRDILFVNEANKVSYIAYQQLAWRTRLLKIIDYNPSDYDSWVYDLDAHYIQSTYKDNPFLSEEQIREIQNIKDPDLYRVFVEGKRGVNVSGKIFKNYQIVNEVPEGFKLRYYGLDFGYHPDPCAMVEIWSDRTHQSIYIREVLYKTRLTQSDLRREMRERNVSKIVPIVADSSEMATINELLYDGYLIQPSVKGAGSVKRGVLNMKRFNLLLDVNSPNLLKEFELYSEVLDIDGKPTGEIADKYNHTIDSCRYAISELTRYYLGEIIRFE